MLLFVLWAALAIGALAGAGYSHYRYRVRNNQYYARLFAKDGEKLQGFQGEKNHPDAGRAYPGRAYALPAMTLVLVCVLVPMSFLI